LWDARDKHSRYAEHRIYSKTPLPAQPLFSRTSAENGKKAVLNTAFQAFSGNFCLHTASGGRFGNASFMLSDFQRKKKGSLSSPDTGTTEQNKILTAA
jgi:hypothetical protein